MGGSQGGAGRAVPQHAAAAVRRRGGQKDSHAGSKEEEQEQEECGAAAAAVCPKSEGLGKRCLKTSIHNNYAERARRRHLKLKARDT